MATPVAGSASSETSGMVRLPVLWTMLWKDGSGWNWLMPPPLPDQPLSPRYELSALMNNEVPPTATTYFE